MGKFLSLSTLGGSFENIKIAIDNKGSASVFGAVKNSRTFISANLDRFFLYICHDTVSAREAQQRLSQSFEGNMEVGFLMPKNDVLLHSKAKGNVVLCERLTVMSKLVKGELRGLVASVDAIIDFLPEYELFKNTLVSFKLNDDVNQADFIDKLVVSNYKKEEIVEYKGCFSVRGDIIDVWNVDGDMPIRIEFFGETVESIRLFAPDTMMSVKSLERFELVPNTDFLVSDTAVLAIKRKLKTYKNRHGITQSLYEIIEEMETKLDVSPCSADLEWLIPFACEFMSSIYDYLPKDAVVVYDEVRACYDKMNILYNSHLERVKHFIESHEVTIEHKLAILRPEKLIDASQNFRNLSFQQVTSSNPIFDPKELINLSTLTLPRYFLNFQTFLTDLKNYMLNGAKVFIYAGSPEYAKSLKSSLFNEQFGSCITDDTQNTSSEITILPYFYPEGFNCPSSKIIIIGTEDLKRKSEVKQRSLERKRLNFIVPKKGDYVVHDKHGIGLSEGIVTLNTRDGEKDYYLILYRGGNLYLPVDQLDALERYNGQDTPTLHKMGGKEFEKVKERVKANIKKLAIDLIALYERRNRSLGFKFSEDTTWQQEMEADFEFTETDDQLIAVSEIKQDMHSGKVMDRLLCGDVGFGKTEVAMRAIFKTVIEGKQCAFLCPTTILCQQHYNTLSARFSKFGIKIDMLSRFVSNEYIKGALGRIKDGDTKIVVATHRMLSNDIGFKDLGLLVLDEEQRFGVEHKEKIKLLKNNVNVLSMSATPIPRTLHMSLSGIRDISTLETPPLKRLPIETYVLEYSESIVKDAVRKELGRDGQVFILYNRVQSIISFTKSIQDLLPDVNVVYAHGQMDDNELEDKIRMFYNKEVQVLVSTTIIENGIDLPDANTIIIVDSQNLGLSQLYQLRGRVGRSTKQAYAYFTVPKGVVLTTNAMKRLDAITSFTELGSGFKIAMQDLEIRGAGNVLGREQHGYMEKVGYDMYCRLLKESVDELRGIHKVDLKDIDLVIEGDTSLPKTFIPDPENRVKFYKKVAVTASVADREELIKELLDIYGAVPTAVKNLINVGLVKNLAKRLNVKKVVSSSDNLSMTFYDNSIFKNSDLFNAIGDFKNLTILMPSNPPVLTFTERNLNAETRLNRLATFVTKANPHR